MEIQLNDRKQQILEAVINEYIETARPVSSQNIASKYLNNLSSSTIRNELNFLEEIGLLTQPNDENNKSTRAYHGRIPSVKAYKLYVETLLDKCTYTQEDFDKIKLKFNNNIDNIESVIKNTLEIISELTNYTSIGCSKLDLNDNIKKIQLFRNNSEEALLIILTKTSLIKDKYIKIPNTMTDIQFDKVNNILTKMLAGQTFDSILKLKNKLSLKFKDFKNIFNCIISTIEDYINNKHNIYTNGECNILNQPECRDTDEAKDFVSLILNKNKLSKLFNKNNKLNLDIQIGIDDEYGNLKKCSVITTNYMVNDVNVGSYGVVGPLRMNYKKVISILMLIKKILEKDNQ